LSQRRQEWGSGVIDQVSADLRAAFPEMKGFSPTNLKYMHLFAEAWPSFGDRLPDAERGEVLPSAPPWGKELVSAVDVD
jgi:hypothetical protein